MSGQRVPLFGGESENWFGICGNQYGISSKLEINGCVSLLFHCRACPWGLSILLHGGDAAWLLLIRIRGCSQQIGVGSGQVSTSWKTGKESEGHTQNRIFIHQLNNLNLQMSMQKYIALILKTIKGSLFWSHFERPWLRNTDLGYLKSHVPMWKHIHEAL